MDRKSLDEKTKIKIGLEAIKKEKTIKQLAAQYGMNEGKIRQYKKELLERLSDTPLKRVDNLETVLKESFETLSHAHLEGLKSLQKEYNNTHRELIKSVEKLVGREEVEVKFFRKFKITSIKAELTVAVVTGFMAAITAIMTFFTAQMACATKEYVEFYEKRTPKLDITLLIQSEFKNEIKNSIQFNAGAYLDVEKKAYFYLVVKNKWHKVIEDYIEIPFVAAIYSEGGENIFRQEDYYYRSKERKRFMPGVSVKIHLPEIQEQFLWHKFKWEDIDRDYTVKIKIDEEDSWVKLPDNPQPLCIIKYGEYKKKEPTVKGEVPDGV